MQFQLQSEFEPTGDQPQAIKQLTKGITDGDYAQTLLGVTGSGKTFTIANVIQEVKKPTLVLSHNKTLVAQLYGEFKEFFPNNSVEYFVSYYDYYQPEAYVTASDTYIEKDLSINQEVEKLRLKTTSSLLSGRRDIIVVASVSCIYGLGNPAEFKNGIIRLSIGDRIPRNQFLYQLVDGLYSRGGVNLDRAKFRVKGDTVDIYPPYADYAYRITFYGDEVEELERIDPDSGKTMEELEDIAIFPAAMYVAPKDRMTQIIHDIQDELFDQVEYFKQGGQYVEAKRLEERTNFDIEMMRELGYCSGVENYSRYFDGRAPGARPFCLLDYFPDDYMMVIDESHVTLPQVSGMYGGDRARKENLVGHGFRLPSAMDNRPLNFQEFENQLNQVIFVSATPADYELEQSEGVVVEQIIRPTGLLDPVIDVRPSMNQIDDLLDEIDTRAKRNERVIVTTLTKRMAEELADYFEKVGVRSRYIHSEVETLERVEILAQLRKGIFDVLIGVNLLREGIDLPEVSLVAILDADKEGFLRSERSLTQIAGRAARNVNGKVIMYADKVTDSMQKTMDETNRRREKQLAYNEEHGITPQTIKKQMKDVFEHINKGKADYAKKKAYTEYDIQPNIAADPVIEAMDEKQLEKTIENTKKAMEAAAKDLDFMEAARLRDEVMALQTKLKEKA